MKKSEVIKESREFDRMIGTCPKIKNSYFLAFYEKKKKEQTCFGISVPKKLGNAVLRNFLKRRTREILSFYKKNYSNSYNCIIIVRKACIGLSFQKMQEKLIELLLQIEKENLDEEK